MNGKDTKVSKDFVTIEGEYRLSLKEGFYEIYKIRVFGFVYVPTECVLSTKSRRAFAAGLRLFGLDPRILLETALG